MKNGVHGAGLAPALERGGDWLRLGLYLLPYGLGSIVGTSLIVGALLLAQRWLCDRR
jgi:hypothetical protein